MIGGIINGVVTTILCVIAVSILERDEGEPLLRMSRVKNAQWESALLAGLMVALICIFYAKALWLAIVCYATMIGFNAVLVGWWHREGSDFLEMIPFVLLAALFYIVEWGIAEKMAVVVAKSPNGEFISSVFLAAPLVILIATIGFFVVDVFVFCSKMEQ